MHKKTWDVYILHCADGSLYTGCTNDIDKRLEMHNAGKGAKYTRGRLPVEVAHVIRCADKREAYRLEAQIKKLTRQQKMHLILHGAYDV